MTDREQTQADLLDQFRQNSDGNPPVGLDAGVAAMAVMLEERLSPPAPSARFVQSLGRRLESETSHSNNHRQAGVLPLLPDQTIPPSPPADDWRRESDDEPRRPWFLEATRIAAAGLAIALVGTILVLLFRDADDAVAPGIGVTEPHSGEILVSWDPNGGEDYKLFIVNTNDGEWYKLTPGPWEPDGVAERFASWSPDGRRVAFIRISGTDVGSYRRDLHVMDADGSNLRNLSDLVGIGQVPDFTWSPDGTQITFSGSASGPDELYVLNSDGSNLRQLTDGGIGILGASWSPDGSQIAFVSQAEGRYGSIYLIDADGTGAARRLTDQVGTFELHWSPDGSQLAFMAGLPIDATIHVVNRDGSNLRRFTDTSTVSSARPRWSPDGDSIAFVALDDGGSIGGTYVANADGSDWRQLTPISGAHEWSPDGSQLAILTSGIDRSGVQTFESSLYVLDADGSNLHPLMQDVSLIQSPAWRPPATGEELPPGPDATPTPTTEAGTDRLYVVTSNGVTVMDSATNSEIYSIDVGNSPDAVLSPDGSRLYVLGAGGVDQLVAFDAESGDELWRVTVEDRVRWNGDQGPSTLAVSPDGSRIYLASTDAPNSWWVQIFDSSTGERIDESDHIRGDCPPTLHPSQDGNSLYVVCGRGGDVRRIDLNTLTLQGGGGVVGTNIGSVMSPDGAYLYVLWNSADGFEVMGLDTVEGNIEVFTSLEQGNFPPVGGNPVTVSPDGTWLFVGLGSDEGDENNPSVHEIAVIDTESWEEIDRITPDVAVERHTFAMSPDGQHIYASERLQSESDGKLIRIDVESGETSTVLVRNAEILRVLTATLAEEPVQETFPAEPPPARLTYGDQTQVRESYNYCWAESEESAFCVASDSAPPSEPALVAPPGADLTFAVDELDSFEILSAYAQPLDADTDGAEGGFPMGEWVDVPFDQSTTRSQLTADLPEGDYAVSVQIEVPLYPNNPGDVTYIFRVYVGDPANAPTGNEIEPAGLAEFDGFPVWSLGDTFGEFVLDRVEEHQGGGGPEDSSLQFHYVPEDGRTDVGIMIESQGPLPEEELRAREESRQGLGEPVVINGVEGWMTPIDDNVRMIELDLNGGHTTIYAPDREIAIAVVESMYWVNAPTGIGIDPFAPVFPDAEVVHVVSIEEPLGLDHETFTVETWIDQTNGDVMVRRVDESGQLYSLSVKHGLTVTEYRSDSGSLNVTTMLSTDDPNLPDPTEHLNMFRSVVQEGKEVIKQRGGEIVYDDSFQGQPAIKLVTPFGETGDGAGELIAYLDPTTLFPIAITNAEGAGQTFSSPTVKTFDRDEIPDGVFNPEIPETQYTYFRERLSSESAAQFEGYPILWLGQEFTGHDLQRIEHYQDTGPPDMPGRDTVYINYSPEPGDNENIIQINSQGPLSDQEWASRSASHEVHAEEIEIDGNRAWLYTDSRTGWTSIEILFPDGYVSVSASTEDQAFAAVEALQQVNGP